VGVVGVFITNQQTMTQCDIQHTDASCSRWAMSVRPVSKAISNGVLPNCN